MPGPASSSYLGNLAAQRSKLSAIRQRLSLEPTEAGGRMRELAPSPVNGPAPVRGYQQAAVQDQPDMELQIPPEKEAQMLEQIQGWIDRNHNGVDDRQEAAGGAQQQGQVVSDPRVTKALSPLADYFRQNGRLPTPEDLQRVAAQRTVRSTLGREPTDDELNLYMTPPEKGMAIKPQKETGLR